MSNNQVKPEDGARGEPQVRSSAVLGVGIESADGSVVCALCGEECEWSECGACGGEGGHDGYEEDPLWYQPGELAPCPQCDGGGGDWWCPNKQCKTQMIIRIRKAKPTPNACVSQAGADAHKNE